MPSGLDAHQCALSEPNNSRDGILPNGQVLGEFDSRNAHTEDCVIRRILHGARRMGHGALQCGCRNLRLHMTAPCPLPHAIKCYTVLSMSVEKNVGGKHEDNPDCFSSLTPLYWQCNKR